MQGELLACMPWLSQSGLGVLFRANWISVMLYPASSFVFVFLFVYISFHFSRGYDPADTLFLGSLHTVWPGLACFSMSLINAGS